MCQPKSNAGGPCVALADAAVAAGLNRDYAARLNWLLRANAEEAERRALFRNRREEEELSLMRHPLSARKAYATYGFMLGLCPPLGLFINKLSGRAASGDDALLGFGFCLMVSVVCAMVGMMTGSLLSGSLQRLDRSSWNRTVLLSLWCGAVWGGVTYGAGGLAFIGIGAIFGLLYGVPLGMAAFLLFTTLHRLLARGGMMDARHFWPLACGIALTLAALMFNL